MIKEAGAIVSIKRVTSDCFIGSFDFIAGCYMLCGHFYCSGVMKLVLLQLPPLF